MTNSKSVTVTFNPMFFLGVLSALFVALKLVGIINWAWGWVFFPWFVAMALWVWGIGLMWVGRLLVWRARRANPTRQWTRGT